jgi:hypothetical protein
MQTRVTAHSQPYRLRQRLEEAGIRHGQEIRADLRGIHVSVAHSPLGELYQWSGGHVGRPNAGDVYFCMMGRLQVRSLLQSGDGRPLPENVVLEGFEVGAAGQFDILNALVQSNGDIRVIVDQESQVVSAGRVESGYAVAGYY